MTEIKLSQIVDSKLTVPENVHSPLPLRVDMHAFVENHNMHEPEAVVA